MRVKQPIAVTVVTTVLGTTGGDRWLYVLEDEWCDRGLQVTHLHITGCRNDVGPMPPARVRVVQGSRGDRRARSDIGRVLVSMWREIRRADVVLIEPQGLSAPIAFLLAKLAGRPAAIYSQGVADLSFEIWEPNRLHRGWVRLTWRHVDAAMCVSPASVQGALRQGVARDRVAEVRTAVDVDDIRRRAPARESRTARERPLLVGCGILSERKGFDRIVLAVAELNSRHVDVDLVIVGPPGDDVERLMALVEDHGLAERVTLVTHEPDAVPYIATADAFVHAARYEPVGLALLEALALGVPVIAVDELAGGPRLVLDGGTYGRLLDAQAQPQDLADALQAHLSDPSVLRRVAIDAEAHVREEFSVGRAANISADLLCRLGERRRGLAAAPSMVAQRR